jgi:hypothetical protein
VYTININQLPAQMNCRHAAGRQLRKKEKAD